MQPAAQPSSAHPVPRRRRAPRACLPPLTRRDKHPPLRTDLSHCASHCAERRSSDDCRRHNQELAPPPTPKPATHKRCICTMALDCSAAWHPAGPHLSALTRFRLRVSRLSDSRVGDCAVEDYDVVAACRPWGWRVGGVCVLSYNLRGEIALIQQQQQQQQQQQLQQQATAAATVGGTSKPPCG